MRINPEDHRVSSVAVIGSYVPRRCGIATFTSDLVRSLKTSDRQLSVHAYAMNDGEYVYPPEVVQTIDTGNYPAYRKASKAIENGSYDILSVQHEYGIFGGTSGSHIIALLRDVRKPIVTTLHTILRNPSDSERAVMDELLSMSARIVVMSHTAIELLQEVHGFDLAKVDFIPHGIPEIPIGLGRPLRESIGGSGPILLTFGLLSPDKGIENVIRALPNLLKLLPEAQYFIVGATHPHVLATNGEAYRQSLEALALQLGVYDHVTFVDKYLDLSELTEYLSATDFYITPYLNPMQITSGTLAYSLGAGNVVISTPYEYAKEVLADGRGILVPFADPDAIGEAILLSWTSAIDYDRMSTKAAKYAANMYWGRVGRMYLQSFERAKNERIDTPRLRSRMTHLPLPETSLRHLKALTDDTGILQHAIFSVPNREEGYCVDDNARALLLTVHMEDLGELSEDLKKLQSLYLAFVVNAYDATNGKFRNFMSYQRDWLESAGSEDSQGRSMWALGSVVGSTTHPGHADLAAKIFDLAAPSLYASTSPRTWAYAVLGASAYLQKRKDSKVAANLLVSMSNRIADLLKYTGSSGWPWPESRLAYANARIPQALIVAGTTLNQDTMVEKGTSLLSWLLDHQVSRHGYFSPIGSRGAGPDELDVLTFDQQPIEAASSVSAALSAYQGTKEKTFFDDARWCFDWFLGRNVNSIPLAQIWEGSCSDGLNAEGVNQNQGAESTLSYLCALCELQLATMNERVVPGHRELR